VELEQEQTLEAWANAHAHATVALQMVDDKRTIPAHQPFSHSASAVSGCHTELSPVRRAGIIWPAMKGLDSIRLLGERRPGRFGEKGRTR